MQDGRPRYVTALGDADTPEGWRAGKLDGGVLVDVENDAVVLENLPMPHSPRLIDGELWLLLSATGELVRVDPARGTVAVVAALNCFVRGLAPWGDYLFIGVSRIRKTSTDFQDLPVADDSDYGGIIVVHRPTAAVVGRIRYEDTVEEIYDIQVLPDQRMPGILNTETADFQSLLVTPHQGYWLDDEADEG